MTTARRWAALVVAVAVLLGWLAVPAPNPACLIAAPYHCDPKPT